MDVTELAAPLSDDSPAGEDLEYDPEFGELERAAQGTAAKTTGEHSTDAIPPDWQKVRDLSLALMERTRDIRVAVHLTNAWTRLQGFAGLRDGLNLLVQLNEQLWDSVHPMLDEDDGDPVFRCNALAELNNRQVMLEGVLDAPLVNSKRAGKFGLRAVKVVAGKLSHKGEDAPPTAQLIDAAFQDVDVEDVELMLEIVTECDASLAALNQFCVEKVGSMDAPKLDDFVESLAEVKQVMLQHAQKLGIGAAQDSQDDWSEDATASGGGGGGQPIQGAVQSRDDVVRVLATICEYYAAHEPSSPVPILLNRAAGLVHKSFEEIVNDLTPGGATELQTLVGAGGGAAWGGAADNSGWGGTESADSSSEESSDDGW